MKITLKQPMRDNRMIKAEVGFDICFAKRNNQDPHFSVTGEIKRKGARDCESYGQLHNDIEKHFPHIAKVTRWHLCFMHKGPMHYIANALYHVGAYEDLYSDSKNLDYMRSCIVFGAVDGDEEALEEELVTFNPIEFSAWLEERLPALLVRFESDIKRYIPGIWTASEMEWRGEHPPVRIARVDFDVAEYVGDENDGVYYEAKQSAVDNKWYGSAVIECNTGSFVENLATNDGPYDTRNKAREAMRGAGIEWCIDNDVQYEE